MIHMHISGTEVGNKVAVSIARVRQAGDLFPNIPVSSYTHFILLKFCRQPPSTNQGTRLICSM